MTHYETLGVDARADGAAIAAAFRTQSKRWHPDLNPDMADAPARMRALTEAYRALSDPDRRRAYDEALAAPPPPPAPHWSAAPQPAFVPEPRKPRWAARIIVGVLGLATAGLALYAVIVPPRIEPGVPLRSGISSQRAYAPNGAAWPAQAGYVPGYRRLAERGRGRVVIDNGANPHPAYVRLFDMGARGGPVAHVFLPARGRFAIERITPGLYHLRYQDLSDGKEDRTDPFTVADTPPTDLTLSLEPDDGG